MANGTASGNKPTGVVDLNSSQTLENKTLDSTSTVLGSSVESPSRLDVRKATQSELESYALTASDGQLCFATDSKKMYQVVDNALVDVGSASGGINYIPNSDFEIDADDWVGDTNLTIARSEVDPLRGTASGVISKGAVDATGQVVKTIPFTIDTADLAKKLYISADVDASDANYADGDLRWKIVKDPNGTPVTIRPNAEDILGGNFSRLAWFQSDASITEYELQIECNSVNPSAYSIKIDNVSVGPRETAYGSAMTDWKSYTPTITNLTLNATGKTDPTGWYRREGDSVRVRVLFVNGSGGAATGSGDILIGLPDSLSVDTSKINSFEHLGSATPFSINSSSTFESEIGVVYRAASGGIALIKADAGARIVASDITASAEMYIEFSVPIQGWSSNALMSEDIGNREVRVRGAGNTGGPVSSSVDINFTKVEDTTGSWSGTVFTAPEKGDYLIDGSMYITASTALSIFMYKNGSAIRRVNTDITAYTVQKFGTFVSLEKGDTLSFRPSTSVTLQTSGASTYHWIHIQKLAQPQTLLETETVAARYTSNNGQSIGTSSIIEYEEKDFDTHNAYNTSNGEYTIPVSGFYNVSVAATTDTGGTSYDRSLAIQKNGSSITRAWANHKDWLHTIQVSSVLYFEKGDTVRVFATSAVSDTLSGGRQGNWFTIARIK